MDPRPHHEEVGENWQPALFTERVIASRALTFHRVMHRECAHAFFSCNAYLETLRCAWIDTKMLRSLPAAYAYLELRRTLRQPDIIVPVVRLAPARQLSPYSLE